MPMYNPYGTNRNRDPVTQAPTVVSFEQEDHPNLSRNLLRDLQAERDQCYAGLLASKDWPDFERRRGLVNGFDTAIALCKQAEAKLKA